MKRTACMAAALLGAAAALGKAPGDASRTPAPILSTDLSGSDLVFFDGAMRETALLVKFSAMAKDRAKRPEVQVLAASVWQDQLDAEGKLEALAGRVQIPVEQGTGLEGKKESLTLSKAGGKAFDKAYLAVLGRAQNLLEKSLEAGAVSADQGIKGYAEAQLATLEQERESVKSLGI